MISDDPVLRDQFYNGNVRQERAAVVLRLAQSWFRFGSLEILAYSKEIKLLKQLVDFIIQHHFPDIDMNDSDRYLALFSAVVEKTASLVARWQSVGFTHGVCNTDNFSILSITIDYGPFGFLDAYDPEFVPNTSDDEGRYSYRNQPDVARFNLDKLKLALYPLLDGNQQRTADMILNGYTNLYHHQYIRIFLRKFGLDSTRITAVDENIVEMFVWMMEETGSDFTMTFRNLGDWAVADMSRYEVPSKLWALHKLSQHSQFNDWTRKLQTRLGDDYDVTADNMRRMKMNKVNPRYVLRNWIAELAIKDTENSNGDVLRKVHRILLDPFTEQVEAEELGFADTPPKWANQIKVSCSS